MRTTEAPSLFDQWTFGSSESSLLPLPGSSQLLPGLDSVPAPLSKPAVDSVRPALSISKASPPESFSGDCDLDSSDDLDPQKKRARAAQARFRAKQKVRCERGLGAFDHMGPLGSSPKSFQERKRDTELQLKQLMEQLQEVCIC